MHIYTKKCFVVNINRYIVLYMSVMFPITNLIFYFNTRAQSGYLMLVFSNLGFQKLDTIYLFLSLPAPRPRP